jgi:anti-sigma regulatory factor (Ser/Thr protein kinase)
MTQPAVLTARPQRRTFPGRPDQVALARDFTRRAVGSCPVLDEAVLLVSELATNALEHTASGLGGSFDVTVLCGQNMLMIAVTDNGSDKIPAPGGLDPASETGRGLELVSLIAARWGQRGGRHGRTVWFELRWETS